MSHVVNTMGIHPCSIYCMGNSGGTGHAATMASEYKVAGLILQSPYTKATDVADVTAMLASIDNYDYPVDCIEAIQRFEGRTLILHGVLDRLIGIRHGFELAEVASKKNTDVRFVIYTAQDHSNIPIACAMEDVNRFISGTSHAESNFTRAHDSNQQSTVQYRVEKAGMLANQLEITSAFVSKETFSVFDTLQDVKLKELLNQLIKASHEILLTANDLQKSEESSIEAMRTAFLINKLLNSIAEAIKNNPNSSFQSILSLIENFHLKNYTDPLKQYCEEAKAAEKLVLLKNTIMEKIRGLRENLDSTLFKPIPEPPATMLSEVQKCKNAIEIENCLISEITKYPDDERYQACLRDCLSTVWEYKKEGCDTTSNSPNFGNS